MIPNAEIKGKNKEDLYFKFFIDRIEPWLGSDFPVIVYEYPLEMCILSERCECSPLYGKRFELYIAGIEIANAFGELKDPEEQERRFKKVLAYRRKNCRYSLEMPRSFIETLKFGIPPSAGIALGIERLFMLFEGLDDIHKTNLF